jgi:hypothetical protein
LNASNRCLSQTSSFTRSETASGASSAFLLKALKALFWKPCLFHDTRRAAGSRVKKAFERQMERW